MYLPARFAAVILTFIPVFRQQRTWRHAELLLIAAILAPGRRTIASLLRIAGLSRERRFTTYHRVLNPAARDPHAAARLLLGLLIAVFAPSGPVLLGIDDTIERRRGRRISAKGIYRDPVRSSKGHFVKASGLRWLSLMLLAPVPWAGRTWALPFLTALAPSERYCRERGRRHNKLTDWARQMALQARRWLPGREIVLLGDSSFAALDFLVTLARQGLTCITRLRPGAALYRAKPARRAGAAGRPPAQGGRLLKRARAVAAALSRATPAGRAGDGWGAAPQGCTPAEARRWAGGWDPVRAANARARLVRGAGAHGRDLFPPRRRLAPPGLPVLPIRWV